MARRVALKWIVSAALLAAAHIVQPVTADAFQIVRQLDKKLNRQTTVVHHLDNLKPEIAPCFNKAEREHMKAFTFVESATGMPIPDQMTIAFYETRMGLDSRGKENIVQIEDSTFYYLFEKNAERYLPTLRRNDPALAAKVKAVIAKKDKRVGYKNVRRQVLRLRKNKKLSLLLVASRIMVERKDFASYAREKGVRLGHSVNWFTHNRGLGGAKDLLDAGPGGIRYIRHEAAVYEKIREAFAARVRKNIELAVLTRREDPIRTAFAATLEQHQLRF